MDTFIKINKWYKRLKIFLFLIIPLSFFLFFLVSFSFVLISLTAITSEANNAMVTDVQNVPESILKHKSTIIKYMKEYDIPENYLPYILAQATQESYGKDPDIFKASESKYNGQMGMIKTAEESIEHTMKRWRQIIDSIEKKGLTFSVELILQTYNFGDGYLDWVAKNGGAYTIQNAKSFSNYMLSNGWKYSVYGDPEYIPHIYRYLKLDSRMNDSYYFANSSNFSTNFPPIDKNHRAKFNTAIPGQCTWYVINRFSQIGHPILTQPMGNGGEWYINARKYGHHVSHTPLPGTAMSFPVTSRMRYGHIAFVEKVNPDGSIFISEMNWKGEFVVSTRTIPRNQVSRYYYINFKK